jgi:tetratricopeptide (TPR) repeat protein
VPPQNSVTHSPFDIPEWFDNDTLRATYLYTEGVRVGAESGSDSAALAYFRKVLEIDSLHAPSHHQISLLEISTNPASALTHSQIAHTADTANIDYLGQLAYTQLVGRQHKTALQNYNKLLRLDSRNPYNYRVAAALYVENNMPYMAVAVLDSAEYKLGFVPELWNDKRNLLLDLKLYDRAIEETLSVVANHPYESDNYRVLADLYARTGNDSLAVVNFEKAVSMAPDHFGTLLSAAKYYLAVGNERKYLAMLQSIFGLDSVPLDTKISLYDNATTLLDLERVVEHIFVSFLGHVVTMTIGLGGDVEVGNGQTLTVESYHWRVCCGDVAYDMHAPQHLQQIVNTLASKTRGCGDV